MNSDFIRNEESERAGWDEKLKHLINKCQNVEKTSKKTQHFEKWKINIFFSSDSFPFHQRIKNEEQQQDRLGSVSVWNSSSKSSTKKRQKVSSSLLMNN